MKQRHEALMGWLLERGRLTVDQLAVRFGISTMTVRRDLQNLEESGLLLRVRGGCVLRSPHVREQGFQEKAQQNRQAKEAIARAVVARLCDGGSLYLDTGTTCAMVAHYLPGHRQEIRVFTNNLAAAMTLFEAVGIEVFVLGGSMSRNSPDLTGAFGMEQLRRLRFDVAVVGADGLTLDRGEFYSAELGTASLSQEAQHRASRVFLCLDSSKLDRRAVFMAGRLQRNYTLFTDSRGKPGDAGRWRKFGASAIFADDFKQADV